MGLIAKLGRPCHVAIIKCPSDRGLQLRAEFYQVCEGFNYRDIMALTRGLGVNPATVDRWKYRLTFPADLDVAMQVMEWAANGKPMEITPAWKSPIDML